MPTLTEKNFASYMLNHFPELQEEHDHMVAELGEPLSSYGFFMWLLSPKSDEIFGSEMSAKKIIDILKFALDNGDEVVKNTAKMMIYEDYQDEMLKYADLLPEYIKEGQIQDLSDISALEINCHIDQIAYTQAWRDEISTLGGLSKLNSDEIVRLHTKLMKKFNVRGYRFSPQG